MTVARKLIFVFGILLPALAGTGCNGTQTRTTVKNEEPAAAPALLSVVNTADARSGDQLLSGFYAVEQGAWRWTAGHFSALLGVPPGAPERGATLSLAFNFPGAVAGPLKQVTLTASVDGKKLASAPYKAEGNYIFAAEVPPGMLSSGSLKVDFALDKSLPPGADKRELGIIATSVGLTSK